MDVEKEISDIKLAKGITNRILNDFFKFYVCTYLLDEELKEDPSNVTSQEIMEKIRNCLAQNHSEANKTVFFHYLAFYPVSMCKREVSPLLRLLIGFHYRLGVPSKDDFTEGSEIYEKISYADLSEIFGRSKATINDCVNKTENQWREFQQELEKSKGIDSEARKALVEEAKQFLKVEGNEGMKK